MPAPLSVALLGFGPAARLALAAALRQTARRVPAYEPVLGLDDARFVVVDAAQPEALALLCTLGRVGDAVLVGSALPRRAAIDSPPVPAPDPVWVLQQLDALLAAQDKASASTLSAVLPAHALPALPDALPFARLPGHPPSPWHQAHDERRRRREQLEAEARAVSAAPRALLVDDSEIALQFLRRQLEGYGLQLDMARHSDRALDLLGQHAYDMVFLDMDLGDDSRVDGLTLCHQICKRPPLPGRSVPMAVMVSAYHDPVHRVRGTLAGAAACLGKPLDLLALDRLMQQQGHRRIGPPLPSPAG
jgi:CheY-like chemotaxis protein